jgi:hypothetical protein
MSGTLEGTAVPATGPRDFDLSDRAKSVQMNQMPEVERAKSVAGQNLAADNSLAVT